jgi:hypothetical protein
MRPNITISHRRVVAGCRKNDEHHSLCQVAYFADHDFFIHPQYIRTEEGGPYDIGLIRLQQAFRFNNDPDRAVGPICLPDADFPEPRSGDQVRAAGWGCITSAYKPPFANGTEMEDIIGNSLKTVMLEVVDPFECINLYPDYERKSEICLAAPIMESGVCPGDSGGPIMTRRGSRYHVMGVAAHAEKVGRGPEMPVVFTSVMHFLKWIHFTIEEMMSE